MESIGVEKVPHRNAQRDSDRGEDLGIRKDGKDVECR